MISKETIDELQKAVKTELINSGETEYVTRPVFLPPERVQHQPKCLQLSTLTGFVEYVENYNEDEESKVVHVVNFNDVRLYSRLYSEQKIRNTYVQATIESVFGSSFSFGTWYDHEAFIIGVQSLFVNSDDRQKVLAVIGTIREQQVKEHSDDGVTQKVTASAGQVLVTEIPVPNPVLLRPFRTFREIQQPSSLFVLRVRTGKTKPECALFEADGGAWKLEAINGIAEYLRKRIKDVVIVA
jgi:hypothetical protein